MTKDDHQRMMQNQLSMDNHTKDYAKSRTYQFFEISKVGCSFWLFVKLRFPKTQAPLVTFLVPLESPR
jgi:hypothetical protein